MKEICSPTCELNYGNTVAGISLGASAILKNTSNSFSNDTDYREAWWQSSSEHTVGFTQMQTCEVCWLLPQKFLLVTVHSLSPWLCMEDSSTKPGGEVQESYNAKEMDSTRQWLYSLNVSQILVFLRNPLACLCLISCIYPGAVSSQFPLVLSDQTLGFGI